MELFAPSGLDKSMMMWWQDVVPQKRPLETARSPSSHAYTLENGSRLRWQFSTIDTFSRKTNNGRCKWKNNREVQIRGKTIEEVVSVVVAESG